MRSHCFNRRVHSAAESQPKPDIRECRLQTGFECQRWIRERASKNAAGSGRERVDENRDLRALLYPCKSTPKEERRRSGRVSRLWALLRAHRLIRKIPGAHRYQVNERGRRIITALLAARNADVDQLTHLAA